MASESSHKLVNMRVRSYNHRPVVCDLLGAFSLEKRLAIQALFSEGGMWPGGIG